MLYNIVDDWATTVVHESCEESFIEVGQMHGGKFPAPCKAMLIDGTFFLFQEGTGNGIHQHHGVALFEVLAIKICS